MRTLMGKSMALVVVISLLSAIVGFWPSTAKANPLDCSRNNFWPTSGQIETWRSGNSYEATLRFRFTSVQLQELKCFAEYVEFDFKLYGFSVPANWEAYSIQSTNVPGAEHDVAWGDPANSPSPGATGIRTNYLIAGRDYYITLRWQAGLNGNETPSVSFTVTPSYWASPAIVPAEWLLCQAHWNQAGWCIFGSTLPNGSRISAILGSTVTGLLNGRLAFDGYKRHSFGSWGAADTSPDFPEGLTNSAQSGSIVESDQGHLYILAGGRLFWFDRNNGSMLNASRIRPDG